MQCKCLFFLCVLLCCSVSSLSQEISESDAHDIAERFFSNSVSRIQYRALFSENIVRVGEDDTALPYIYKGVNDEFVVISRKASDNPILAYGECADDGLLPPDVQSLMKQINLSKPLLYPEIQNSIHPIQPLLKTVRSQYAPFNECCPFYVTEDSIETDLHCMVGCVATALEEILTYYAYPKALKDTLFGWERNGYKIDTIFPGTKIDFSNILSVYTEGEYNRKQVDAVASLCYYCGVAAHMNWGLNSSGTSINSLEKPLRSAFDYGYVRHIYASDYTPKRWHELIQGELEALRPVLFAGYTSLLQGHAFVIDGINADGYYHIHWGYGGKYDGYFDLSVLNTFEQPQSPTEVGRLMGHFCNQEALFLYPDSVEWETGDTITHHDNLQIDSVAFSRHPDCNGYVTAELFVRNITDEPITTTVELLTFAPDDSAAFLHGDYLALTGASLDAYEKTVLKAICKFSKSGERVLGISDNDSSFLYVEPLQIEGKTGAGVVVEDVDVLKVDDDSASFVVRFANCSDIAWDGSRITYSLFRGDYTESEGDIRQWKILNLSPSQILSDTITFAGLQSDLQYTFVVRNPWLPEKMCIVQTHQPMLVKKISESQEEKATFNTCCFDLNGIRMKYPKRKNIYINKGRVIFTR